MRNPAIRTDGLIGPMMLALLVCASSVAAQSPPSSTPTPKQPQRVYPPAKPPQSLESRLGEPAARVSEPRSTTLQIDLLMSDATQSLQSQTWGRVFDVLGHRVRVKTGGVDDEPAVTESRRGPLRTVHVVGSIDRHGKLSFPGKSFNAGDEKALKEWLEELEAYGAQGNPAGRPRWGLSTEQFQNLFTSLAEDVAGDVKDQPLIDAVRSMGFMIDIPLRIHDSVATQWKSVESPLKAQQDVRNLSRGSALAILLNDHDLCVRPLRTPSGAIELVVQSKAETPDPWPLGWEPRAEVQRSQYAPSLFAFVPIGFLERPVSETLDDARAQTNCAIVVDRPGLARKDVDLSRRTYGIPQKKTAWILVLQAALTGTGLVPHIRIDEAGRGFIVVAPFDSRSMGSK